MTAHSEYIDRIVATSTAKSVSLNRERDWLTGLSFQDYEPYTGRYIKYHQERFPGGHVSVYHSSEDYWQQWHLADAAVARTTEISRYARAFFALREVDKEKN